MWLQLFPNLEPAEFGSEHSESTSVAVVPRSANNQEVQGMIRRFIGAGLLMTLLLFPTAPVLGGGAQEDVTRDDVEIRFWALMSGPDGEVLEDMVDTFNQEHDDITVLFDITDWDAYYEQLTAAIAGGDAADVAIAHTANLPAFADERFLYSFNDAVDAGLLNPETFVPRAWDGADYDGLQFGVPFDTIAAMVLYVNDLYYDAAGLEGAPADAEELVEYARLIQENTDAEYGFEVPFSGIRLYRYWYSALHQNGGQLLTDDNSRAAFNTPEGRAALQYWVDMIYEHELAPDEPIEDAFQLGIVGMILDGVWMTTGFDDHEGLSYSLFAIPALFEPGNRSFFSNSHNFILPRQRPEDEAKRQAAFQFVSWMSDNSRIWSEEAGMVTARADIIDDPTFTDVRFMEEISKQVEYATYPPRIMETGEVHSVIIDELERAIALDVSVEQALNEAERRVNAVLGR